MDTSMCMVESVLKEGATLMDDIRDSNLKFDGISKLQQKTLKEIYFLRKNVASGTVKSEYVKCNPIKVLTHYWNYAKAVEECKSLFKKFYYNHNEKENFVLVDVVSHGGKQWNKIICRNPRALTRIWKSEDDKCKRLSLVNKGEKFINCSMQNQIMFKSPRIVFYFPFGIESELAYVIRNMGICVVGEVLPVNEELINLFAELRVDNEEQPQSLNLDVTAMIAYTTSLTSMTSDNDKLTLSSSIIREQAKMETTVRVKELLDDLFRGKELICCKSALKKFTSIVETVAGPTEKERAACLLERVTVVDDNPSDRATSLRCKGKINPLVIAIFGTGDRLRIPTVTSSIGFVNAAKQQGVYFAVYLHDLRLFSENPKLDM